MARIAEEKQPESIFDIQEAIKGNVKVIKQDYYGNLAKDFGTGNEPIEKKVGAGVHKVKYGERQPMAQTAKNPALEEPQVMAQRYFGQQPGFKLAIDQLIPKVIGVYLNASSGAGITAFNLRNLPVFGSGGTGQLTDIVVKMVTGGVTTGVTDPMMKQYLENIVSSVATIAGAKPESLVSLNKSDNIIPLLSAFSGAITGGEKSPFSTDVFSNGVKLANDVQKHLQNLAGGQANYQGIIENLAAKATSSLLNNKLAPTGAQNILGNIVGQTVTPVVKQGTEIIAHIVKQAGQF